MRTTKAQQAKNHRLIIQTAVDLMTQRLAAHEKAAWMLRSTLGSK